MTIRIHCPFLAFAVLFFGLSALAESPHVLLIVSDDLSPTALGCEGNTVCKTPNLDRLATQGVRFEQAPGIAKGKTSRAPVELIDLYPTIAAFTGLTDKAPEILEGHSLLPLLREPGDASHAAWPRRAATTVMGSKKAVHRSIKTADFRYSRYADGEEEFYDHTTDPDEFTNQATNREFTDRLKAARGLMNAMPKD